jgi:hypothetical protein
MKTCSKGKRGTKARGIVSKTGTISPVEPDGALTDSGPSSAEEASPFKRHKADRGFNLHRILGTTKSIVDYHL